MTLLEKYILKKEELASATLELFGHYEPILKDKLKLAKTNIDCKVVEEYLNKELKKNYITTLYSLIYDRSKAIDTEREKTYIEKEGYIDTNWSFVCNDCGSSGFGHMFKWVDKDDDDYDLTCLECGSTDVEQEESC